MQAKPFKSRAAAYWNIFTLVTVLMYWMFFTQKWAMTWDHFTSIARYSCTNKGLKWFLSSSLVVKLLTDLSETVFRQIQSKYYTIFSIFCTFLFSWYFYLFVCHGLTSLCETPIKLHFLTSTIFPGPGIPQTSLHKLSDMNSKYWHTRTDSLFLLLHSVASGIFIE